MNIRWDPGAPAVRAIIATVALVFLLSHTLIALADAAANGETQSPEVAARTAAYYDPERSGEGVFVEILPGDMALVYFLSFGPKDALDTDQQVIPEFRQTWMLGLGTYDQEGIIARLIMPTGGHFGAAFDPDEIEYVDFGWFFLEFPTCGTSEVRGRLKIEPVGDSKLDFQRLENGNYVQLSEVIDCETGLEKTPRFSPTGSWYEPSRPGEGLVVEVLDDHLAIVLWLTYDDNGNQMWIHGVGNFDEDTGYLNVNDLWTFTGTYWGTDFDPDAVIPARFGSLALYFYACIFALMDYDSPVFGSGTLNLERLTWPLHVNPGGAGCWDY